MRCYQGFRSDEALRAHLISVRCEVKDDPHMEGISQAQIQDLKRRIGLSGQSEEDKWRYIYQLLFPETSVGQTPSPCETPTFPTWPCRCWTLSPSRYRGFYLWTTWHPYYAWASKSAWRCSYRGVRKVPRGKPQTSPLYTQACDSKNYRKSYPEATFDSRFADCTEWSNWPDYHNTMQWRQERKPNIIGLYEVSWIALWDAFLIPRAVLVQSQLAFIWRVDFRGFNIILHPRFCEPLTSNRESFYGVRWYCDAAGV